MKSLKITQNTAAEKVTSDTISKLYKLTVGDSTTPPLAENVELEGYIRSDYGKRAQIEYLKQKFPKLQIDVPESGLYLDFDDPVFEQFLISTYCPEQSGVTIYTMTQIKYLENDTISNSEYAADIETIDFRHTAFTSVNEVFWNCPKLKNIYIKSITNNFKHNDFSANTTIDKIIIGEVGYINGNPSSNAGRRINTLAIRKKGSSSRTWGSYMFRGVTIGKLYIGDTTPMRLTFGYGDNIDSCEEIYVPTGCAELYAATDGWSTRSTSLGYKEYDFDTDPDGIFSVLDT